MASSGAEESKKLILYSYFRSSSSCRVRIALNLKGIDYEYRAVNLLKGEQLSPEYLEINPMGFVPALVDGDITLADSFAIIMYLDEKYPHHPLLPKDLVKRAVNYQAANIVSSSIHPLHNVTVLKYIGEKVSPDEKYPHHPLLPKDLVKRAVNYQKYIGEKVSPDEKIPWVQFHIRKGFVALEKLLNNYAGKYATGDEVFMADLFLAPQIHGAIKRFNVDMTDYPLLSRLYAAYEELPAFQDAMPEKQPDTPIEA